MTGTSFGQDGAPGSWPGPWGLRDRLPGHALIEKVLVVQAQCRRRNVLQRIFGTDPLAAGNRSWYKGALGEIAVGYVLQSLGPEWTVLHSVPVGSGTSDIDHVLIGPAGVITINTKNHGGQAVWVAGHVFMVSGRKQRHLQNASYEANRTANLLGRRVRGQVPVTGVIVVRDAQTLTIKSQPIGAVVLTDRQLVNWLKSKPTILNPWQVQQLVDAATLPSTWHRSEQNSTDPATLRHEFTALQIRVNRAKAIRGAWAAAALLILPLLTLANLAGR